MVGDSELIQLDGLSATFSSCSAPRDAFRQESGTGVIRQVEILDFTGASLPGQGSLAIQMLCSYRWYSVGKSAGYGMLSYALAHRVNALLPRRKLGELSMPDARSVQNPYCWPRVQGRQDGLARLPLPPTAFRLGFPLAVREIAAP